MKNKTNDANCETGETKGTIKILVQGGIVQDVMGLPKGYDYEVDDRDI